MLIRWLFLKKNTILVWNRLGVIVSMLSSWGVPSFQSFSNPKTAFVNDARIVKVYAMVEWPRMFCNVWASSTGFNIPDMWTRKKEPVLSFFLRNSHLISTFSLCFYPYFSFYLTFSVYIIFIFYSFLSVEGCRATAESSCSFNILSQWTFLL